MTPDSAIRTFICSVVSVDLVGVSGDVTVDTRSIGVGVSGDTTVDTRGPTMVTFEIWSADFPGVTSLIADTDKDGLTNLMEYALVTNPLTASA